MEKIQNYADKLTNYYKKTKVVGEMIVNCRKESFKDDKEDIVMKVNKIQQLYQHYFQLLDKMLFYNKKIMDFKFNQSHIDLEKNILKWKKDADIKYQDILEWHKNRKELIKKKDIINNQIGKLKLLYNEHYLELNKTITERITKLDQYIVYHVNNVIDYLLVINESMDNMKAVTSLYRIGNILKNMNDKSMNQKQVDFNEVYTTIEKIVNEKDSIFKKVKDIETHINERKELVESIMNKIPSEYLTDKQKENLEKMVIFDNMINNNKEIIKTIEDKQTEHLENAKDYL